MSISAEQAAFRTRRYVPDDQDAGDTTARREGAVAAALLEFSRDVPCAVAAQAIDAEVAAADVEGWQPRFSRVLDAAWPALSLSNPNLDDEPTRALIEVNDADQLERIRFPDAFPDSGSPVLFRFSGLWTLGDDGSLPTSHEEPLVMLASARYAQAVAGVKANAVRLLPGGQTEFATEDEVVRYRDLAESLYALYRSAAGLPSSEELAAAARAAAKTAKAMA